MDQAFVSWKNHRTQMQQQAERNVEQLKRALETCIASHGLPEKGAIERYCRRIGMTLEMSPEAGISFSYADTFTLYQAMDLTPMPGLLRQYYE